MFIEEFVCKICKNVSSDSGLVHHKMNCCDNCAQEIAQSWSNGKIAHSLVVCTHDAFEEFWEKYPRQRRGNKDKAHVAWDSALKEKRATKEEIIDGVCKYRESDEVAKGFAKGAASWLNDDRWAVDYSPEPTGTVTHKKSEASYTDQLTAASRGAKNLREMYFGDPGHIYE